MTERRCTACGKSHVTNTLGGEHFCSECALAELAAVTSRVGARPAVVQTLPLAPREPQRKRSAAASRRRTNRTVAERRALSRLKLMHLPEYNVILADEMARDGRRPPTARPLDDYLRNLAAKRLAALARRVDPNG